MSYEGYVKALCVKGHLNIWDAHDEDDHSKCETCKAKLVWEAHIDQTNCDINPKTGREWGDVELEVAAPAVYKTCEHCKHSELIEEVRYKIPTNAGFTYVKGFVVDLSVPNDIVVANKLVELGLTPKGHLCWFDCQTPTTCLLSLGAECWTPDKIPAIPPEVLAEGVKRNERYEFNGGSFTVQVAELLQCTSVAQVIDLVHCQNLGWRIAKASE